MAELEVAEEESAGFISPVDSDDESWESAGEESDEVLDDTDEESIDAVETIDSATGVETEPDPKLEKRYKDLEREFHKRNEERGQMRDELQQLRLERLELKQQMEQRINEPKEPEAPDPGSDSYFDDQDRQTLEEFGELSKTFRKLVEHEVAKKLATGDKSDVTKRLDELQIAMDENRKNQFANAHAAYMRENVGEDYIDIDQSQDFYDYVTSSPMRHRMMTESKDARDHASVMQEFLNTPKGRNFRGESDEGQSKQKQRRKAASGLAKNTAARPASVNTADMTDDELWDSI